MSGMGVSWAALPWPTLLQVKVKCLQCLWRRWSHQVSDICPCSLLMHEGNYLRQMSLKSWDGEFVGFKSWRNVMCWCYWLCCHGQCHHPPPLRCVSVGSRLEQQFRAIRAEMSGFHAKLVNVDGTSPNWLTFSGCFFIILALLGLFTSCSGSYSWSYCYSIIILVVIIIQCIIGILVVIFRFELSP